MIATATIQSFLGITGDDAILETIEPGVVAFLERVTGRLFTSPAAAVTEILNGGDAVLPSLTLPSREADPPWVLLKEEPNSLTSVSFRDTWTDDWTTQTLSDFEFEGRRLFAYDAPFPAGTRNVRVIYNFGWAEDSAPADVHLAALRLIGHLYNKREIEGVASGSVDVTKLTLADFAGTDVGTMIESLKRPCVPV